MITRSEMFQHGEERLFWERFKSGTVIGPLPNKKQVHIDQIHFMTISDPSGEFHVGVPLDNGRMCPIQFLSVTAGRLPTSLGLLRGAGSNEGVNLTTSPTTAFFVPHVARMLAREFGSQPESYWAALAAQMWFSPALRRTSRCAFPSGRILRYVQSTFTAAMPRWEIKHARIEVFLPSS